jgi:hypothetical protein
MVSQLKIMRLKEVYAGKLYIDDDSTGMVYG